MPTWAIILSSIITVIIIMGGAISFPYIPMLFGVYDAERYSLRGKLILKLIWLFPFVAMLFLYLSWTSNGLYSLAPFIYIIAVWSIRANKGASSGPGKRYTSKQQNLQERLDQLDYVLKSWTNNESRNNYLLFSFFSPSPENATVLKDSIGQTEKLHSEIEESVYDNNSSTIHVRTNIDSVDKDNISSITQRMIDIAWNNNCELVAVDIMEDEE